MTTTLSITLPSVASVTRADWGAVFHRWAKAAAVVVALAITAWVMAGEAWHRLVAWANAHHLAGPARLGLPGATSSELQTSPQLEVASPLVADAFDATEANAIFEEMAQVFRGQAPAREQRFAPAPLPTIAAPPLESLTVAQLRQMARAAGHKGVARSGRRAELLQVLAG